MSNLEKLKQVFIDNKDKRICVLGTTCTGKTTLINESNMGVDMPVILVLRYNNVSYI